MKVFAVDKHKEDFVVFCIEREDDLNAYVWVSPFGVDKLTDIYGLCAYCNHEVEPLYVGSEMPEELIEEAYKKLEEMPEEEKKEKLERFNKKYSQMDEEEYKERKEYEEDCLKEIEKLREDKDAVMYFM